MQWRWRTMEILGWRCCRATDVLGSVALHAQPSALAYHADASTLYAACGFSGVRAVTVDASALAALTEPARPVAEAGGAGSRGSGDCARLESGRQGAWRAIAGTRTGQVHYASGVA